ncbi:hypothetical protein I3760_13G091900 [Carya illinoinensis]|nr:hypothetical protein I3760_13G091900 [Carya illinoinensis]
MIHALWSYPATFDVWVENANLVNKWKIGEVEFVQMWIELYRRLPKAKLEVAIVIIRRIWSKRNDYIFENKFASLGKIVHIAIAGLEEFHLACMEREGRQSKGDWNVRRYHWRKLEGSISKANFDAKMQKMGVGIVVRDRNGDVLDLLCALRNYVTSPFLA